MQETLPTGIIHDATDPVSNGLELKKASWYIPQ